MRINTSSGALRGHVENRSFLPLRQAKPSAQKRSGARLKTPPKTAPKSRLRFWLNWILAGLSSGTLLTLAVLTTQKSPPPVATPKQPMISPPPPPAPLPERAFQGLPESPLPDVRELLRRDVPLRTIMQRLEEAARTKAPVNVLKAGEVMTSLTTKLNFGYFAVEGFESRSVLYPLEQMSDVEALINRSQDKTTLWINHGFRADGQSTFQLSPLSNVERVTMPPSETFGLPYRHFDPVTQPLVIVADGYKEANYAGMTWNGHGGISFVSRDGSFSQASQIARSVREKPQTTDDALGRLYNKIPEILAVQLGEDLLPTLQAWELDETKVHEASHQGQADILPASTIFLSTALKFYRQDETRPEETSLAQAVELWAQLSTLKHWAKHPDAKIRQAAALLTVYHGLQLEWTKPLPQKPNRLMRDAEFLPSALLLQTASRDAQGNWQFDLQAAAARADRLAQIINNFTWNFEHDVLIPALAEFLQKTPGETENWINAQIEEIRFIEKRPEPAASFEFWRRLHFILKSCCGSEGEQLAHRLASQNYARIPILQRHLLAAMAINAKTAQEVRDTLSEKIK